MYVSYLLSMFRAWLRFVAVFVVCMCSGLHAVNSQTLADSVRTYQKQDSVRVRLLNNLFRATVITNPDTSFHTANLNEALSISKKLKWDLGIVTAYHNLGILSYYLKNNPNGAVEYFNLATAANKDLKSQDLQQTIYGNLGNIYLNMLDDPENALINFKRGYEIFKNLPDQKNLPNVLISMGEAYYKLGKKRESLKLYEQCIALTRKSGAIPYLANALSAAGLIYVEDKNFDKGIKYLDESLMLAEQNQILVVKCLTLGNLAMAKLRTNALNEAEVYGKEALSLSEKLGMKAIEKQALLTLAEIYSSQNHPAKALQAYRSYMKVRDSLAGQDIRIAVTKKEMEMAHEKKEALLLSEHSAEIKAEKNTRNTLLGGAAIVLLASAVSFAFYKRKRDADEQIKRAELEARVADTELKALKAQMNPHFIFNSLNTISDYILRIQPDQADLYLTRFARLMRLILENSEQDFVPLNDELEALELYMQLEKLRVKGGFGYLFVVDESVDREDTLVPPLLLQPFVENSIWHGIAQMNGSGLITIGYGRKGDMLECIVEDNGLGRDKVTSGSEERKSMGISITQSRIDILNARNNSKGNLRIEDLPVGTKISLTLPYIRD